MKFNFKTVLKASASLLFAGAVSIGLFTAFNDSPSAEAAEVTDVLGTKRFIINNPYKDVDWDTWQPYKGATHVHTEMSDGDIDFDKMVEKYYELGYDCLSITDHGTVNYGWSEKKSRHAMYAYNLAVTGTPDPLSSSRMREINAGTDRGGRGMIDVPMGIELNGASVSKTHINGYYADAGDGDMELTASGVSGCVTAVKKNHNKGGITHINHVGEFMAANDHDSLESCTSDVYTQDWIDDFADDVFMSYSSCTGMELVNTSDSRTRWDRYLFDEILRRTAPSGRMIWGYCEDDAHEFSDCDRNAQIFWMPSNTQANVKTCMQTGAFFASSKSSKSELSAVLTVDKSQPYPEVTRISIDELRSQITFHVKNASTGYILGNRKNDTATDSGVLETVKCEKTGDVITFDLNKYEKGIGSFFRVYFIGTGGITYVQPFQVTTTEYGKESAVDFSVSLNGENVQTPTLILKNAAGVMLPVVDNAISITEPGTYTYEASANGSTVTTGSFEITEFDIAYELDYSIDIEIEEIPEFVFVEAAPGVPHEATKIIDGLEIGVGASTSEFAVSSSSLGTVEMVPTENGYGTGTKLNLIYNGEIIDSYTFVIYGDTDGDTIIDATDASALKMYLFGSYTSSTWSDAVLSSFDVNNDGIFDSNDVVALRRIGMLEEVEIEQNR